MAWERRRGDGGPQAYAIRLDPRDRIIRIEGHHHWTIDEARAFLRDVAAIVAQVRARGEPVMMMIDRRRSPVLSKDVAAVIAEGDALMKPGDRVAFLVDSSLMKVQIRRIVAHPDAACFLSPDAATTWLTDYAERSVA